MSGRVLLLRLVQAVKSRILLVDDDGDNASVIKMVLEFKGYDVDVFTDPQKAASEFEPFRYVLALIDLKMKELNGFALYEQLAKVDGKMKVCFMTAFNYEDVFPDIQRKHHLSSECYIKKPFDGETISDRISLLTASA